MEATLPVKYNNRNAYLIGECGEIAKSLTSGIAKLYLPYKENRDIMNLYTEFMTLSSAGLNEEVENLLKRCSDLLLPTITITTKNAVIRYGYNTLISMTVLTYGNDEYLVPAVKLGYIESLIVEHSSDNCLKAEYVNNGVIDIGAYGYTTPIFTTSDTTGYTGIKIIYHSLKDKQ